MALDVKNHAEFKNRSRTGCHKIAPVPDLQWIPGRIIFRPGLK
jgi:hypothetical protein